MNNAPFKLRFMKKYFLFLVSFCCSLNVLAQDSPSFEVVPTGTFAPFVDVCDRYTLLNFGTIPSINTIRPIEFLVINHSDSNLIMTRVRWAEPMCGPQYTREPIAPGDTGKISYFCNPYKRVGPFNKVSYVQTNQGDYFIRFKGYCMPTFIRTSSLIRLDSTQGKKQLGTLKVKNTGDAPLAFSYSEKKRDGIQLLGYSPNEAIWIDPDKELALDWKITSERLELDNHFNLKFRRGEESWLGDFYFLKE